jgi:hypothetical protein
VRPRIRTVARRAVGDLQQLEVREPGHVAADADRLVVRMRHDHQHARGHRAACDEAVEHAAARWRGARRHCCSRRHP